mmetsp:Transcript_48225/g.35407  ORF Transcript_48225/g.35407 Transcript_48225/m.35407 type:complete len:92 (-) Transcript_48225:137-412(-)|eukprot:CAMPEP_0202979438 /NCGR_PEP_ID=MMETSP1396-20130829/85580_1 /ASSEMBLY_ACC=CAM_ASM_000872 /TAXON_ID= /ORGANISM="Pseudokeronopsis sp., Strain Brazil" /LENGTH=91 /DNA_ID=CAMNT_0049718847 /DNA_START=1551 /DNA_END=1826 /DNA_ORIENTATION=+
MFNKHFGDNIYQRRRQLFLNKQLIMLSLFRKDKYPSDRFKQIVEHLPKLLLLLLSSSQIPFEEFEEQFQIEGGDPDAAFGAFDSQQGESAL